MKTIKQDEVTKNGKVYYRVMKKGSSIFAFWYEEFGSFDKVQRDTRYIKLGGV